MSKVWKNPKLIKNNDKNKINVLIAQYFDCDIGVIYVIKINEFQKLFNISYINYIFFYKISI